MNSNRTVFLQIAEVCFMEDDLRLAIVFKKFYVYSNKKLEFTRLFSLVSP